MKKPLFSYISSKFSIVLLILEAPFSRKSYIDVPLIIELKPKNSSSFTYLSHFAHGEKGIKDLVEKTKDYEYDNGVHRFSYKLKSLNRSEEPDIGMMLGVLFEGEEKPEVVVSAVGLSTREFNIKHSPAQSKVKRDAFLLLIAAVFGIVIVTFLFIYPVISRLTLSFDRNTDKRYARQMFYVLRAEKLHSSMTDDQLKGYLARVLYKRQLNCWNSKSWLAKWSLGMRKPEPEDYRIV